jgi:predicted small lipoprotein YifL
LSNPAVSGSVPRTESRRALLACLATGGAASLAGCGEVGFAGPPAEIPVSVRNDDDAAHTVTVTVSNESGERVVSADATVAAGVDSQLTGFENPEERRRYVVAARLASGVSVVELVPVGGASGTRSVEATVDGSGDVGVSFLRT